MVMSTGENIESLRNWFSLLRQESQPVQIDQCMKLHEKQTKIIVVISVPFSDTTLENVISRDLTPSVLRVF